MFQQIAFTMSLCLLCACEMSVSKPPPISDTELQQLVARANAGNKAAHWELFSYFDVQNDREQADKWYARCLKIGESTCTENLASQLKSEAYNLPKTNPQREKLFAESKRLSDIADKNRGQ
jgi:hypothetical protein